MTTEKQQKLSPRFLSFLGEGGYNEQHYNELNDADKKAVYEGFEDYEKLEEDELRDKIAIQIAPTLYKMSNVGTTTDIIAERAYEFANAMLKERKRHLHD